VDAPGAAVEQLSAGDLAACFEGLLDGGLVRLACGGEGEPLGIEGLLIALFCQKCGLQLGKGQSAPLRIITFQLLGELADGGGELLGLAAQLPQRT
jgi:hypothetical protein